MSFVRPMDGSAIAVKLGITRQAVSNILKRAMKKYYLQTKKMDPEWGPFECSCAMMRMLGVANNAEEIKKFYNLFPPDVRDEIEKDAIKNHCSKKMREEMME